MEENGGYLYKIIGRNIKEQRKIKGLGQEDLANLISLSRSSVSNIELGNHQPSIQIIYEIVVALDCEISDILPSIKSFKTSKAPIRKEFEEIIKLFPENKSIKTLSILKEILNRDD